MPGYKNKEELQKRIHEGYLNEDSYESIGYRGILLEKVLNIAKNNKDDIFKQIRALVEEVKEIEKELSPEVDTDQFIDDSFKKEDLKSAVIDELPITTLAIKKLDDENVETLKWLLAKKTDGVFDKNKIFELDNMEFKKLLCNLFKDVSKEEVLKDNEKSFTDEALENNTVEALAESFVRFVGKAINEEVEEEIKKDVEDENDYFYLVKKQIDSVDGLGFKKNIENAYESISNEDVETDPSELIDEVPDPIKAKVSMELIKNLPEDTEEEEEEESEDVEFQKIVDEDEELNDETLSTEEQVDRQENILESLKNLYIIKRNREMVMLENSKVLETRESKNKKLNRSLIYEEAVNNNRSRIYGEKITKINILVESLFRKYAEEVLRSIKNY